MRLFTRSYCCILSANFLFNFGIWLLVPILPFYLRESYGLAEGTIGLVLAFYILSGLLVRPFSGYLLDSFPRKPLYITAYTAFTLMFLGYILCGTLVLFVFLRMLHGFAFGTVSVGGNTIVVDIMPSERRGEGLGYYGLANNLAMSTGPMVGLLLHGTVSYRWIFALGMLVCIVGLTLAMQVRVPRKPTVKRPPISLDRFILYKGLPAGISLLLLSIPYGSTTNYVAMYVEEMGLQVNTGLFFVLMAVGMGVSRIFSGKYVDRGYITECIHYGFYLVVAAFCLLGICKEVVGWNVGLSIALFMLVPLMQGVGFGIMFPAYNSLFINLAPNNRRATATSTYLTSWDIGIGLGMVLSGLIAEWINFQAVYFIGAALSLGSMLYFDYVVTPHYRSNRLR